MGKDGAPVSINHLSEQEHISSVFLEQIFFKLRKAGIVSSVRGPGGGFYFAQPLDKLTIKAILDAAGEELDSIACDKHHATCDRIGACLSHRVWTDVTSLVNDFFKNVTLASILETRTVAKEEQQENAGSGNMAREPDSPAGYPEGSSCKTQEAGD
jgi:Rrf2 family iron-sulfur cluster assembly transcriptional regulator